MVLLVGCSAGVEGEEQASAIRSTEAPRTAGVAEDHSDQCPDEGYADFKAHLASRGVVTTCDEYSAYLEAGSGGETAGTEEAASYVEVPDLVGLDPNTAADAASAAGLRLSNGRVGAYGVVANQSRRPGTMVEAGSSILITVRYSGSGSTSDNGGTSGGGRTYDNGGMSGGGTTYDNGGASGGGTTYDNGGMSGGGTTYDNGGMSGGGSTYDNGGGATFGGG